MSMTVKKLIAELEKVENKLLEVEVLLLDKDSLEPEIMAVQPAGKKVLLRLARKK